MKLGEPIHFPLSIEERDTIYLACELLLAQRGITSDAKARALKLMRRLQDEEEKLT